MSSIVDVTGVDRAKLLQKLWENAKPASFFTLSGLPEPEFDLERAQREIHTDGYVDYVCGRCIKTSVFSKETAIDGRLYDREYGLGSFKKIVDQCKK